MLNYGKAKNSLALNLGLPRKLREQHPDWNDKLIKNTAAAEAQAVIDAYFTKVPKVKEFMDETYYKASINKLVETKLGRRRYLRDLMDWNEREAHRMSARMNHRELCWCNTCKISRESERKSVNTIIQGDAADIVMMAMLQIDADKNIEGFGARMLLQIHDEIIIEVPEENVKEVMPRVQYHMEHPGLKLRVPLHAEPHFGRNWIEAKG